MTFAVRALSVFLTVWLTAAAAFPPCCWSMAYGHDHRPQPTDVASQVQGPEHHHHHTADSGAPGTATMMSAMPAPDCDAESAELVATTNPAVSRIDMHTATATAVDVVVPQVSARLVPLSDFAPPGASPRSAFLNPLRV